MIPDDELDEMQRLCDAASAAPWQYEPFVHWNGSLSDTHGHVFGVNINPGGYVPAANGRFIAAAREALPRLIAEIRELRADSSSAKPCPGCSLCGDEK